MRTGARHAKHSFFQIYWKIVAALFAFEILMMFMWNAGMLGESCRFNGSAVAGCYFLGMNVDALADTFLTMWMIPIIGVVIGIATPFLMAIWPSVAIFIITFFLYQKDVQDLPEPPKEPEMPKATLISVNKKHVPSVQRKGE